LFRLSQATVHRWTQETTAHPKQDTVGTLVKPVPPVRRYADVVRHLVQAMALAGFPGSETVAQSLARVGWRLSKRTVQRIREQRLPAPPPKATQRHVSARYPHHVWMADLTEVPGLFRLFSFKVAVILDVFSRLPLASRVFTKEPTAMEMLALVEDTTRTHGRPRHFVSDQGAQLTATAFRETLAELGIRQRFGAIGRTGSIAIVERFWRSLKDTLRLRSVPPLLKVDLERRLGVFLTYYSCLRPHQGLGGATPAEVLGGVDRARLGLAPPPPRGRPGEGPSASPFEIAYLDPEHRLPFLVRKAG
jgi:transposase InsO family protein